MNKLWMESTGTEYQLQLNPIFKCTKMACTTSEMDPTDSYHLRGNMIFLPAEQQGKNKPWEVTNGEDYDGAHSQKVESRE